MSNENECPIWKTPAEINRDPGACNGGGASTVDSARAGGRYWIADIALSIHPGLTNQEKAKLTTWLVEQRRLSVECPEVTSAIIDEVKRRRPLAIHVRADQLLRYLSKDQPSTGEPVNFSGDDKSYFGAMAWSDPLDRQKSQRWAAAGFVDVE